MGITTNNNNSININFTAEQFAEYDMWQENQIGDEYIDGLFFSHYGEEIYINGDAKLELNFQMAFLTQKSLYMASKIVELKEQGKSLKQETQKLKVVLFFARLRTQCLIILCNVFPLVFEPNLELQQIIEERAKNVEEKSYAKMFNQFK